MTDQLKLKLGGKYKEANGYVYTCNAVVGNKAICSDEDQRTHFFYVGGVGVNDEYQLIEEVKEPRYIWLSIFKERIGETYTQNDRPTIITRNFMGSHPTGLIKLDLNELQGRFDD